jgi:beta-phosphoglucomutase-like phosphatase (HAD superfamily)
MKLKALIFDVDGTLADTEEAHRCAFNQAFQQQGLHWNWSKHEYAGLLKTAGGKERLGAYIDSMTLTPEERRAVAQRIPALHEAKTDNYTRMVRQGLVPLREGVARLIDEAGGLGVRLGIASTTTLRNIDALLRTNLGPGALQLFSSIGAGDQVARKKPAPDIYEFVLGELGEPPQHCVAVEDSANGLKSSHAAGLFTVVTPSYWTRGEDFSAADWVLPSLGRLDLKELERRFE